MTLRVLKTWTNAGSEERAVADLAAAIRQPGAACVMLYASPRYDLVRLAAEVRAAFPGTPIVGCTTAGEVVDGHGYAEGGIAGLSLASPAVRVHQYEIADVAALRMTDALELADRVRRDLAKDDLPAGARPFGLLVVDGLCGREEIVAASLHAALSDVPTVGGSAGDAGRFQNTAVFAGGAFRTNAATLTIVHTTLPFRPFMTHHFDAAPKRVVVTSADPAERRLRTLDGRPAAEVYASLIGADAKTLSARDWSCRPLLVQAGGQVYIRSIQQRHDDGSLSLYCAIEQGLVLRVAQPRDLVGDLRMCLAGVRRDLPTTGVVLAFDCIQRREALQAVGALGKAGDAIAGSGLFAFSTYGEQVNGLHVNQTLTGVALAA